MKIKREAKCGGNLPSSEIEKCVRDYLGTLAKDADPGSLRINILVQIPSGGDYSGVQLDIEDAPLCFVATWVETVEVDS